MKVFKINNKIKYKISIEVEIRVEVETKKGNEKCLTSRYQTRMQLYVLCKYLST